MYNGGYERPAGDAQRHRRSERASWAQQPVQRSAGVYPAQGAPVGAQPTGQPPTRQTPAGQIWPAQPTTNQPMAGQTAADARPRWQPQSGQPSAPFRGAQPMAQQPVYGAHNPPYAQAARQPVYSAQPRMTQQDYQQPRAGAQPGAGMARQYPWQQGQGWQQTYGGQPVTMQPPVRQGYQPPPPAQPPRRPSSGGEPPRKPPQKNLLRSLLGAVIGLALVTALCLGGYTALQSYQTNAYVSPYDGLFCQGVYVDGIHLGGMTQQEALNAVTAQAQQRSGSWSVRLTYQGQLVSRITAGQLGMTVNVGDVMSLAWAQGHTGTAAERKQAMEELRTTPFEAYTATPSGDTAVIDSLLSEIKNHLYVAPQDAAILTFDPVDPSKTDPFTFQNEVYGRTLNIEPIKERLYQMVATMESGEVELVPDVIAPAVTVEQLKKKVALRATASTPISSKSTENRTNNIRRAFERISGTILKPGKEFSFNATVGQRTVKNGFFEAIEYAYGESVMGVGGGVCQASSTLYQAAVCAGLEIVKREQHSAAVNYTSFGLDATVYWEGKRKIDFSFRNNTDSDIYIVAAVQSDPSNKKREVAKVSIYGIDLENVRYEFYVSQQELEAPTEPEYIKDKKAQYVVYTDEEKEVRKAKKGYIVDSYRVKYVDNVEVDRMHLYTDNYEPKPRQIYVGVTERYE